MKTLAISGAIRYTVGEKGYRQELSPFKRGSTPLATDMTLRCRECEQDFIFSAGEQDFFASKGLTNMPTRCPKCRSARRSNSGDGTGRPRQREYFSATCSNCGREARVPFQPRGDRPVYCSECFQQLQAGSPSRF